MRVQNDLPDGAELLEVDEDDVTPDMGQTPAPSCPSESDILPPVTPTSNGSHKTTFLERRKEKGRHCTDELCSCYSFILSYAA